VFLEGFEFGASAWLDRFDLVRQAAFEAAFPITGTGVLLLDDRRSKRHRQLRRGGLGIPLRWLLIEGPERSRSGDFLD